MGSINEMGQTVQIRRGYQIQYADPITVRAGESLTVGRVDDDSPSWRWCRAPDGRQGWVPVEFLSSEEPQTTILKDYSARELQVVPGEEVTVEDARHGWLLVRNVNGERGWIPAGCLG
jgi:SH3-like domain-containing protein